MGPSRSRQWFTVPHVDFASETNTDKSFVVKAGHDAFAEVPPIWRVQRLHGSISCGYLHQHSLADPNHKFPGHRERLVFETRLFVLPYFVSHSL
jgi:hypothetical protein